MLYEVITPAIASEWEDPAGVPISAILIGGRRPSTIPLVHESLDWKHGVFLGSIMGSEITAAAIRITSYNVCYTKLLRVMQIS